MPYPCGSCCLACEACLNQNVPSELSVAFSGIANGTCDLCEGDLNVTLIMPNIIECETFVFEGRTIYRTLWGQNSNPQVPDLISGFVRVRWDPDDTFSLITARVSINNESIEEGPCKGFVAVVFQLADNSATEPPDCRSWTNFSLPRSGTGVRCDQTSATCLITAL